MKSPVSRIVVVALAGLTVAGAACAQTNVPPPARPRNQGGEQQRSRRSQRVKMPEVSVASPDGKVKFTVLPNAERLTYTVTFGDTTVIEPSSLVMNLDGFDLSSGVVFSNARHYEISETYPWNGAHSTATNRCHGVRIELQHDLSFINYTLEIRAFDDGVA